MRNRTQSLFVALLASACTTERPTTPPSAGVPAESLLVAEIGARLRSVRPGTAQTVFSQGFPRHLRVDTTTSAAVPGVRYYKGTFIPSNTYDVRLVALAGGVGDSSLLLGTEQGWARLVRQTNWSPTDDRNAISACEELVRHALPSATDLAEPIVYRASANAAQIDPPLGPREREQIEARARPPVATRFADGKGWVAELWVIEEDRTAAYRCSFAGQGRALEVQVSVADSLPCTGQSASCEHPTEIRDPDDLPRQPPRRP